MSIHRSEQPPRYYAQHPLGWALSVLTLQRFKLLLNVVFAYLNNLVEDRKLEVEAQTTALTETMLDFSGLLHLQANLKASCFTQIDPEASKKNRDPFYPEIFHHKDSGKRYIIYDQENVREEDKKLIAKKWNKAGSLLKEFSSIKLTGRKWTVQWLENAEKSKVALNAFWEEVRRMKIEEGIHFLAEKEEVVKTWKDIALLEHYQDPEFLNSIREEQVTLKETKTPPQEKPKPNLKRPAPLESQQATQTVWGEEKTSPKRSKAESGKPLKRNQIMDDTEKRTPEPVVADPTPTPRLRETVEVSPASLRLFARLWPHQSGVIEEKTLRWNDFQAALHETGLRASGIGGSKISFSGRNHTIVIHCPHGSGNVPLARRNLITYGRRLARRFGWGYDTFVEKK